MRQLQKKYLAKTKPLYFNFINLEKAFDKVLLSIIYWSPRKLEVQGRLVRAVPAMHSGAVNKVRFSHEYSDEFRVQIGVHQGSVLSLFLFIIILLAITEEFKT